MTSSIDKRAIWLETERQFDYMFQGYRDPAGIYKLDRCLHWALAAAMALRKVTRRDDIIVMGGSANFWANESANPDESTHVGYFWQDDTDLCLDSWLGALSLPEVHCWAFLRDSCELIDPSVLWIPTVAIRKGINWTRPKPTEWLWCHINDIPEGWFYIPSLPATKLVTGLCHNVLADLRRADRERSIS